MKSVVSSTLLIIVYTLSLHGFIFSQEIVKTQEVVVDGIGVSPEAAKKNAFRNAVSKVVGSFIENDILIKNDKIIEDKLLEYSGGFVETFEVISESKDKDGLFKVKLKAKIAQQTVVEKLRTLKIDVIIVSGSNLKAQLETQKTMKNEGGKLINSIMEE
jgi:ribosomal protein S8